MDAPPAPPDASLKNIIDKLAEFVARNGPEFEQMTKEKQQGNPKFGFLYGGEYYQYYQYRIASERAFYNKQMNNIGNNQVWSKPPATTQAATNNSNVNSAQIEALTLQQTTLRDQIRQSEQNLQAQHGVLHLQQQKQIEEAVKRAQSELLQRQANEADLQLQELDKLLQPIIETCTKDSISNGKSWILQHTSDAQKCHVVSQYLLKKAMVQGADFSQKLHLIYLVNDVIHHCVRKNCDELKKCLENVVIPMFCSAQMCAKDEQRAKLTKLLTLWESKSNFFDACVISKLKAPPSSLQEYQASLLTLHAAVISAVTQTTKATFENYQQQHQVFVQHATQQINLLEAQKQQLQQPQSLHPELGARQTPTSAQQQQLQPLSAILQQSMNNGQSAAATQQQRQIPSLLPPEMLARRRSAADTQNDIANRENNYSHPPPDYPVPDMSRPPPGFDSGDPDAGEEQPGEQPEEPLVEQPPPEELRPTLPYFELPAGLMVPLIRLEDYHYRPIDPEDIRLPAPAPPSERLINAVEAFYAMPSHERPRDGEGWEKLGLYEYFKMKNAARKDKEDEIANGVRERSRSPSPIVLEVIRPPKRKKRIYRSKSRSRSKSPPPSASKGGSGRNLASTRRSPSPPPRGPPPKRGFRDRERSLSPPSFGGAGFGGKATDFAKMGWQTGGSIGGNDSRGGGGGGGGGGGDSFRGHRGFGQRKGR